MIEDRVIFATSHKGEASQVRQRSSRAILSIEPEQGVLVWELVLREIPTKSRQALTQFLPIPPVTFVPKTAEPLKAMSLADDGARPDHLPALASGVAGSTHVIQPAKRRGQVFSLRQGARAGGFSRAIEVYDHPGVSRSIHQSPSLLLVCVVGVGREWATEQIIEKERPQGFDGGLGQCRHKARKRRAGGEVVSFKQRHERTRKGLKPLVEGLQGAFPADGIAEEHREKIDHLIAPEAPPRKTHALSDFGQNIVLAQVCSHQHHFSKPGRGRGDGLGRGLDLHRSIGDTGHMCLLDGNTLVLFHQEGTYLGLTATDCYLVAQSVGNSKGGETPFTKAAIWGGSCPYSETWRARTA
jgi:hypothetical protein